MDDERIKKIKELYKKGCYEEIAGLVNSNFRIIDIIKNYNELTEAEKIITAISYYIYRLDNPLKKTLWNFEKEIVHLDCEMFHLGGLDEGIKELIDEGNEYFKENVKLFVDVDFLNNSTPKAIMHFYNMGYKNMIIDNVKNYKINSLHLIEELLLLDDFKNSVITKKFLLHGFNSRYKSYFFNLPDDRKKYIGLYGSCVFGNDNYSMDTCDGLRMNLREIFKNNFPEFEDELIERLVQLYGKISYQNICDVIKNVIEDIHYLDKMQVIADDFFNGDVNIVLAFACKYPNLSFNLFKLDNLDVDIVTKIGNLVSIDVLENIDNLSVEDFLECNIDDFSFSLDDDDFCRNNNSISPVNLKKSVVLYSYCYEIAIIDINGNWNEYLVKSSHYETLNKLYSFLQDGNKKSGLEILYSINKYGDIVLAMENAGLIIWVPSIINKEQRDVLLEKLELLKEVKGIDIFVVITNLDKKNDFTYLNNSMSVSLDIAIDSVKRIRLEDSKKLNKKK